MKYMNQVAKFGAIVRRRVSIGDLRHRYSRSDVTIWRWYTTGDFPKPHYLHGKRFWWLDEVEAYEARQVRTYDEHRAEAGRG